MSPRTHSVIFENRIFAWIALGSREPASSPEGGPSDADTLETQIHLGLDLFAQGQIPAALNMMNEALGRARESLISGHWKGVNILSNVTPCCCRWD